MKEALERFVAYTLCVDFTTKVKRLSNRERSNQKQERFLLPASSQPCQQISVVTPLIYQGGNGLAPQHLEGRVTEGLWQ